MRYDFGDPTQAWSDGVPAQRSPHDPRPGECALSTAATTLLRAAAHGEEEGGFHPPSIAEFFPAAVAFAGTPLEINRIILVRIIAALVLCALFLLAARSARLVPGRGQGVAEMALSFVRVNIAQETLGHHAKRFVPMLTTIFFTIVALNLTGVVPFLNIASTSLIGMPVVLALWVYVMYLAVGVRKFGVGGYLRHSLMPPGLPKPLYLLITPIEALQVFVFRPATLALRLTANMIAGHLILVLTFAATHFFLLEASGAMKAFSVVSLAAGIAFTLFEILVALLQAYVFTLLSAVYLSMAIEEEH